MSHQAESPRTEAAAGGPARVGFRTTVLRAGGTATGIEVSPEVVEKLGHGRRPPVRVTINGHTYRSTVAVMGGAFMVGISAANRALAGVAGGDEVDVELELDTEPREVAVPPELAAALDADPAARARFAGLSYSRRRALAEPIEAAKTAETRQRRVDRALGELRAGT